MARAHNRCVTRAAARQRRRANRVHVGPDEGAAYESHESDCYCPWFAQQLASVTTESLTTARSERHSMKCC